MRRILALLSLLVSLASCGGEPLPAEATGTTEQALATYILGGCCTGAARGYYLGPAPIWYLARSLTVPPSPLSPSANSSLSFSTAIASEHTGLDQQSIRLWMTYQKSIGWKTGIDVSTGDGTGPFMPTYSANNIVNTAIMSQPAHPGDHIGWYYSKRVSPSVIQMSNDNASGLGVAYATAMPYSFTAGTQDPDTIYPLQVSFFNFVSCAGDAPAATSGGHGFGSYVDAEVYGQGPNGPINYVNVHPPTDGGGCGMEAVHNADGTNTIYYSNATGT